VNTKPCPPYSPALAIGLALWLLPASWSQASDLVVDDLTDAIDVAPGDGACATASGTCTLRAAVMEANALPGPDRVLLGPGTHVLSIDGFEEDEGLTGDVDVTDDLELLGAGRELTIIDGQADDRLLHARDVEFVVRDVTLTGGQAVNNTCCGGMLFAWDSLLVLRHAAVTGCLESDIAIRGFRSDVLVEDLHSFLNTCDILDIGEGLTTVRDSAFDSLDSRPGRPRVHVRARSSLVFTNSVIDGAPNGAAGIAAAGLTVVTHSIIRSCSGGALFVAGTASEAYLVRCSLAESGGTSVSAVSTRGPLTVLESELAFNMGGALAFNFGACRLIRSSIHDNDSEASGGGVNSGPIAVLDVVDSTISNNTAGGDGGGLSINGSASLINTTITGNHAMGDGGGIYRSAFSEGLLTVANSVFQGNTADNAGNHCIGTITLLGPMLIGEADPLECELLGDLSALQLGTDPLLAPLDDYGGPTSTRFPLPGSPALDAGSPLPPGSDPAACSWFDQRGVPRPQGLGCDLGAVEVRDDPAGIDTDGDGVLDACDVCPDTPDQQRDRDGDGLGDACDPVCGDEPSALDLAPLVQPLRVGKDPENSGWIELTWESDGLEADHELVQGSLASLATGAYDHAGFGACRLPTGRLPMRWPRRDSYFLVIGRCSDVRSSAGRDSFGAERPPAIDSCR